MSRLEACPGCHRHVRVEERACPFCQQPLSLASLPARVLPKRRLGRAASFAFGASVVGATTLVACGDDDPAPEEPSVPVYGAPAAGTSSGPGPGPGAGGVGVGGEGGASPADSGGTGGEAFAVYGGPPGGEGAE